MKCVLGGVGLTFLLLNSVPLNSVPISPLSSFVARASGEDPISNLKGPASYQWPASPGPGYGGVYIEDDISHTRRVSTLSIPSKNLLCSSTTETSCADQAVQFYAILPRCVSSDSVDCIESISVKSSAGAIEQAQFERYFPEQGLADFTGSAEAKIPSGASSSLWNIPSAPHAGGNEYLAVVSVSGSADSRRNVIQSPIVHASLYPVQIVAGKFSRNVPFGNGGVSHRSVDPWANCASIDEGYCAARQEFPSSIRFSMAIRLSSSPNGWLHGRIFDPEISFTKSDSFVRIQIEADPVQVPAIATWTEAALLPKSYGTVCTGTINCPQSNPQSDGAVSSVEDWRALYQDKASWTRTQWFFQTLRDSPLESQNSIACFGDKSLLQGFVTTNAAGYSAGPPSYSTSEKAFRYTVSSPHFDAESKVLIGTYSFVIRTSTARCLYGIEDGDISAKLTISASDRGDITETLTESVSIDSTWLKVNATGFHYSSPVIKTSLWSSATAKKPTVTTKKTATAKAFANYAKLTVEATSTVTLKVSAASKKYCTVVSTKVKGVTTVNLKGLKKGTCKVTVTVTPKTGAPKNSTITLKIT